MSLEMHNTVSRETDMDDEPSGDHAQQERSEQPSDTPPPIENKTGRDARQEGNRTTQSQIAHLEDRIRGAEKWMIWFTGAIAFFGLCSAVVGVLQWSAISAGSVDTHTLAEAAKKQAEKMGNMSDAADKIRQAAQDMVAQDQRIADNAKASLDASNRQSKAALDATIKDFQREQRAWVGLGQYAIQHFDDKEPFRLAIPFVNSGKSPAILTEDSVAFSITDHRLSGPPTERAYQFEKSSAIPPQGSFVFNITNRAVPAAYEGITNGTVFLSFFGEFRYRDVYDPNTVHTTDFCLTYDKDSKMMVYCYTGNDMN